MSNQNTFNASVVTAARELVASAGLSHLPLLDAMTELRRMHKRLNERDWAQFRSFLEGDEKVSEDAAMQSLP